jgi:hypothetical protein
VLWRLVCRLELQSEVGLSAVEQTHISWVRFVLLATMIFLLIVVLALTYRFCCWNKRRRVSSYLLLLAVLWRLVCRLDLQSEVGLSARRMPPTRIILMEERQRTSRSNHGTTMMMTAKTKRSVLQKRSFVSGN